MRVQALTCSDLKLITLNPRFKILLDPSKIMVGIRIPLQKKFYHYFSSSGLLPGTSQKRFYHYFSSSGLLFGRSGEDFITTFPFRGCFPGDPERILSLLFLFGEAPGGIRVGIRVLLTGSWRD